MDLLSLGEVRGFRIQYNFSPIGPGDQLGLCVRITPMSNTEMTADEVRRLEKRVLVPRLLAYAELTVMPFSPDAATMQYMKNNLQEGKNWGWNIQ